MEVNLKLFENVKIGCFAYLVPICAKLLLGQKVFENSNSLYSVVALHLLEGSVPMATKTNFLFICCFSATLVQFLSMLHEVYQCLLGIVGSREVLVMFDFRNFGK